MALDVQCNPTPSTQSPTAADHGPNHPTPTYDAVCERAVRCTASRLFGRYGYREQDREDIVQDLALSLLQRISDFDSSRSSWRTFVERCVEKAAASLVRHRMAQCRHPGRAAGIDPTAIAHDGSHATEDADPITEEDPESTGVTYLADPHGDADIRQVGMAMDLEAVMARMTPFQREVCVCLKTNDREAAAQVLGVKRWRIWHAIPRIRRVMEDAGITTAC